MKNNENCCRSSKSGVGAGNSDLILSKDIIFSVLSFERVRCIFNPKENRGVFVGMNWKKVTDDDDDEEAYTR